MACGSDGLVAPVSDLVLTFIVTHCEQVSHWLLRTNQRASPCSACEELRPRIIIPILWTRKLRPGVGG